MGRCHHLLATITVLLLAGIAASAQAQEIDFSGEWNPIFHEDGPEREPGPEIGDYLGLPINDAARLRAESWSADRQSAVVEYQCRPHAADYSMRGLAVMRVMAEVDPITQRFTVFKTRMGFHNSERTIYIDGRPHPPDTAVHTWGGFSTATWEGSMLKIRTTHLKPYVARRNGVPTSDKRTMLEYWVRHGSFLTIVTMVEDPVFLTERLVRSQTWALDPGQTMGYNWCDTAPEEVVEPGTVPNYLPGKNPYLHEFADSYGLPYEATRGGAETIYPEYRSKMPQTWSTIEHCTRFCSCFNERLGCPFELQ